MRALAVMVSLLTLPACSMVGQPAMSLSDETAPYPDNYAQTVSEYFAVVGPPLAQGSQLSEPRTAPASMFEARAWYSCLRQPSPTVQSAAWVETVIMYREGRVHGQIPGPAPHFCDAATYHPILS